MDCRRVGVEVEVGREVIGRRVVEVQLACLDHLHDLGRDHGLGDAVDGELIVDPYVSNAVRLAGRSAPRPVGGHHRGRHPGAAGHVIQDRLELRRRLFGDGVLADIGERLDRNLSADSLGEAEATDAPAGSTETVLSVGFEVDVHAPRATTRTTAEIRP